MSSDRTWVSDNLIKLSGASDSASVDFLLASGQTAKGISQLQEKILSFVDGDETQVRQFGEELYRRVSKHASSKPRSEKKSSEGKVKEKKQKYALLDMNEDLGDAPPVPQKDDKEKSMDRRRERESKDTKRERSREDRHRKDKDTRRSKKLRRKDDDFEDRWGDQELSEEEEFETSPPKRQKMDDGSASPLPPAEDPEEELDEEERDKRERIAFEERLREREKESRKKKDDAPSRRTEEASLDQLRLRSRQEYLQQRSAQQLALLRIQVAEETQEERENPRLSAEELEEFRRNRELLRLAEERNNVDMHDDAFHFQDDYINEKGKIDRKRKEEALYKRYTERDRHGQEKFTSEFDTWEEEQSKMARAQAVARPERVDATEYDYVFDEDSKVKFQGDATSSLPGEGPSVKEKLLLAELEAAEKKADSIEESRKRLPIYAYKKLFLRALSKRPGAGNDAADELTGVTDGDTEAADGEYLDASVLVVVAETGSGKTTQLPAYLYEGGFAKEGKIVCTQPRRIAAMSVAARVAEELGSRLGQLVGYSVRFDRKFDAEKTKIEYMTDGLLLRELLSDPFIPHISAVVLDEIHERGVNSDVLLALLKNVSHARPEFKLVISSATLNAKLFSKYMDECPILSVPGRTFPVSVLYTTSPESDYVAASVTTVLQLHLSQPLPGDILVFLTGEEEITAAAESLEETARRLGQSMKELIVAPVYSNQDQAQSMAIFNKVSIPSGQLSCANSTQELHSHENGLTGQCPPNARKVILATNIAETSLTVDGIKYVVDSGFSKQSVYNPRTRTSSLVVTPISKANAMQRSGRAGRVGPGTALRLYTKWSYLNELEESPTPEILRTNLSSLVLLLLSMGITDILNFDFLSPPPPEALISSLEVLYALGALTSHGELSARGRRYVELPVDCYIAAAIVASGDEKYKCTAEVTTILSILAESAALFLRPKDKQMEADSRRRAFVTEPEGGDFLMLLNVYNQFEESGYSQAWCRENFLQYRTLVRVRDVREQMLKLCDRIEVVVNDKPADSVAIRKAILAGYFLNVSKLSSSRAGAGQAGSYTTVRPGAKLTTYIHPSSMYMAKDRRDAAPPKMVIYHELVLTSKEYMRNVMEIQPEWLNEVAPHYHKREDVEKMAEKKPKSRM